MPALVAASTTFHSIASKAWMAGTSPAMTEELSWRPLKLVCQTDQAELQRIAEVASVVCGRAKIEIRGAAAGNGRRPEVDVAKFRACGPVRREHVLDTEARGPTDFRLLLVKGGP